MQTTLGRALIATKSYAAPEVEHAYTRALELCRQVGETQHLFQVLWGLRTFYLMRTEFQKARVLAEEMLTLAQHQQDAARLLEAHQVLGKVLFWLGELGSAQAHVEQVMVLYNTQQHRSPAFIHGVSDLEVRCLSFAAWVLGLCGYPDQAAQRSNDALAIAQELAHPFSVAYALNVVAWVHQFRREVSRIHALTDTLLALCHEQGFGLLLTAGTILQGWVLAEQGQEEAGTAQMRQGLAARRATGMEATETYYLALLAEGYGRSGQPEEGLTVLAEALAAVDRSGVRFYEAELYRLKGELLLAQAGTGHKGREAEACFRQALAVARHLSSPAFPSLIAQSIPRQ